MNECKGCKNLTSDNACLVGALYGMKRCIRTPDDMKITKYTLIIKPALIPKERHEIGKVLEKMGYDVWAGGTCTDMSSCDIAFRK